MLTRCMSYKKQFKNANKKVFVSYVRDCFAKVIYFRAEVHQNAQKWKKLEKSEEKYFLKVTENKLPNYSFL